MKQFQTEHEFLASLDKAQREYFLDRLAELQHPLQDVFRNLSRVLGTVGELSSRTAALLAADASSTRRALRVDGVEYRYSTVPGSGRIKLSSHEGVAIAMWDASHRDPWVVTFDGFNAFEQSGHADSLHRLLLEVDRRRRSH